MEQIVLNVLILEDRESDAQLIVHELRRSGYRLHYTRIETESDFLNHLQQDPDIILSDYSMPQFDAIRALQLLKSQQRIIPFIIISGTIGEDVAVQALHEGAWDYLLKDRPARLGEAVRRALDQRRLLMERQQIREKLDRDAMILANVQDAVVVVDRKGIVTYWNEGATSLFGWLATEVIGYPYEMRFPENERASLANPIRMRAANENWSGEYLDWRKDGTRVWVDVRITRMIGPDPQTVGHLGIFRDISLQKQAEERLLLRDRAIQAVTQGILITDPNQSDNIIVFASRGFERMTGYTCDEVIGQNCRFLQGPDTDKTVVQRIRTAIQSGQSCTAEILNYTKNGNAFWNHLQITPVFDGDRLVHFVGVQTDITERRRLEEQFRQAQKMEAIGQLAGGVAHDFNNLLTVINGYSDLLLESTSPREDSRELISEIHKAGLRSAGLTRQLLAFSRQQVLAPRILDLNTVLTDVEKLLRRMIGEDVNLNTSPALGLWSIRADPGQLEQVLLNLSINARDAMETGGNLTIQTQNVELRPGDPVLGEDGRPGQYVLLQITDTGCGMTPEIKARIFEPFFTTKGVEKGTGLGLATVYGIVKQSDGHITVDSTPNVGTTFRIYLPRIEEQRSTSQNRSTSPFATRGVETILLVEDDGAVRALTRHILTSCGYTVLEASSGEEAIRVATEYQGTIHLVVTDVVMPGINGRVVAEQLTKSKPGLRVLFLSGYTNDTVVRHGIFHDKVDFLQKPFSPSALAHKIREVLDTHR